jgi:DUF917 family protein
MRDREWRDENGYMIGTMYLGDQHGNKLSIWFKNENHVVSLNDVPIATSPDLISVVDAESGEPYTNAHKEITQASGLVVIVSPAPDRLKQSDALKFQEPNWYGIDIAYKAYVPRK